MHVIHLVGNRGQPEGQNIERSEIETLQGEKDSSRRRIECRNVLMSINNEKLYFIVIKEPV